MNRIQQTTIRKRSWFFGSDSTKITLVSEKGSDHFTATQLTSLTVSILNELKDIITPLSTRVGDEEVVTNLRGRPAESFVGRSTAISQKQEELLFIAGKISSPIDDEQEEEEEQPLPFTLAVGTKFKEITAKRITHQAVFSSTGNIATWKDHISAATLFQASQLEIETFRLGFEHFTPSLFGSMLGSIPAIHSRFYLTLDKDELSITIESDKKADRNFTAEFILEKMKNVMSKGKIELLDEG